MSTRLLPLFAALPLLMVPLACATHHDDPLPEPTASRDGEVPPDGRRIEVLMPAEHAGADQIHAVVEHLEGQADVAGAKAMVHASSETGEAELVVELWGQDMPTDEELEAELYAVFPFLPAGSVVVEALEASEIEVGPPPGETEPQDPDELRQQIIDDLRAKGVEGEIEVTITDHPDGRREVQVEVHDDEPPPA
ncbi:MAG: hypothetical protein H6712_17105 [Myxococcales bacterium]|nr:hypothetical protein [Myxococcales bacterium]MCB9715590.1 hypothetical protein [Myxococcales bacterium]